MHEPDGGTRPRAEAIVSTNVLGMRLLFLPQIAEIVISVCTQFLTFAQILAVPLANPRVPDSPTVKICTHKNYGTNDISPNLCHFLLYAWSWLATLAPHQSILPAASADLGSGPERD